MSAAAPSTCDARAEQLQRALHPLVVTDARVGAQRFEARAAVFREPQHPVLVLFVARVGAVAQETQSPDPHRRVEHRPDDERPVAHEEPLDRLERETRRRPRRRIARRDLARVGEARLERGLPLPVDDGHLVARLREVVGGRHADHAAAEDEHFHSASRIRRGRAARFRRASARGSSACSGRARSACRRRAARRSRPTPASCGRGARAWRCTRSCLRAPCRESCSSARRS